ncbi:hypothetical protein Tco_0802233 [Tanacetum coccineum]|uniref:Uncharacterized protein n=1 Tax=Tanacetum coccineum TaxID=301880 RepID=A0ABQ4ZY91_9ASTR
MEWQRGEIAHCYDNGSINDESNTYPKVSLLGLCLETVARLSTWFHIGRVDKTTIRDMALAVALSPIENKVFVARNAEFFLSSKLFVF